MNVSWEIREMRGKALIECSDFPPRKFGVGRKRATIYVQKNIPQYRKTLSYVVIKHKDNINETFRIEKLVGGFTFCSYEDYYMWYKECFFNKDKARMLPEIVIL